MRSDIGPIVQRILQRLVLAGVPLVMLGCGENGAKSSGAGKGTGGLGTGGLGTGGASANTGGNGGTAGPSDGSVGGEGGHQACRALGLSCGSHSCTFPDGTGGAPTPLPLVTATVPFDPDDPRWADLYRACVNSEGAAGCGPNCLGLCTGVIQANGGTPNYTRYAQCDLTCGAGGQMVISYTNSVCGRRPSGGIWGRCTENGEPPLGRFLARAAELEAASIPAFRRVVAELTLHGAPTSLINAARVAMTDEARHWRNTRVLARRRGGHPVRPRAKAVISPASLQEMAIDNVIEGCVRETYGAMVAAHQAVTATDPEVRGLMTEIAEDELNHAVLSWEIDSWACAALGSGFQSRRSEAARGAVRELILTSAAPLDAVTREEAGLLDSTGAQALLSTAWTTLWKPRLFA